MGTGFGRGLVYCNLKETEYVKPIFSKLGKSPAKSVVDGEGLAGGFLLGGGAMTMLSKYLSLEEYRCRCCGQTPPDLYDDKKLIAEPYRTLFSTFDQIRDIFGKPIPVSSGYRCVKHNKEVKGEELSVHIFGLALDLLFGSSFDQQAVWYLINTYFADLRAGFYKNKPLIHIDVGYLIKPRATKLWHKGARWTR